MAIERDEFGRFLENPSFTYNDGVDAYVVANNTGTVSIIDIEVEQEVGKYAWNEDKKGYFITWTYHDKNKQKIRLHHLIKGKPPENLVCDHIDNKRRFDNRLSNLQFITNRHNCTKDGDGKGAGFKKRYNVWVARIALPKTSKGIHLGNFDTKEEAQKQYQRALAIIETCTKQDLIYLRNKYKRKKKS